MRQYVAITDDEFNTSLDKEIQRRVELAVSEVQTLDLPIRLKKVLIGVVEDYEDWDEEIFDELDSYQEGYEW